MWEKTKFGDKSTFWLFGNHMCVRRLPGEEFKPECLYLMMKHLLKDHGLGWVAHSEFGHRRWTCLCDQVHLHTADVGGAISTSFQHQVCFKDDSEPYHRAKLVTNWKHQNNNRTLQSLDLNLIEILYRKVALEIVRRNPTIKHELIESLIVAWNRRDTHDHLIKLSTQYIQDADKR